MITAILDPSQRNLCTIDNYLTENNVTASELLSEAISKYTRDVTMPAVPSASRPVDDNASTSTESSADIPWKKAKLDMLAKHGNALPARGIEFQQYRSINVCPDDLLKWWESEKETFPRLSKLALCLLAVPATSAPSERVFSTAGLTISSKRSQLSPSNVNKIIVVHDNSKL